MRNKLPDKKARVTVKNEDRKIRSEMRIPSNTIEAIKYGAKSALNMTVLQWQDIQKRDDENMIAGEKARQRFGTKLNADSIRERETSIEERSQIMDEYRERELKNRQEYEAYYNSLGNNDFVKIGTNLTYGAATTFLNPIEFTKNMAINATVNALVPGAGAAATATRFGVNMLADTLDNYYSNTWEDDLLGLEREPSEKVVQAVGGALISNAVFPLISFSGKKFLKSTIGETNLKGKTVNSDILNPNIMKEYQKGLAETTAVDLTHRDFKIADSIKKEAIKQQPIEDGLQRVFTKQEIKDNIIFERTGYKPGIVDYAQGKKQLFVIADKIKQMGLETKRKSKTELSLTEAEKKANAIGKMAEDWTTDYFVAPYKITKDGYNTELIKSMRDMHPMFYDTLGLTFKGKGYNDLLGEALQEKSVAHSLIFSMENGGRQQEFFVNNPDGWNIQKLKNYSFKKQTDFRQSVKNGITYNPLENEILLKTSPKYNRYFTETKDIGTFTDEVVEVFSDWKNKKIKYDEVVAVLEGKRARFESFDYRNKDGNRISYKEFLTENKKDITGKGMNIDKLTKDIEVIKEMKVDTAVVKLMINKQKMLDDLVTKDSAEWVSDLGENVYLLRHVADGGEFDESFQKSLWHKLSKTTKDVREIVADLEEQGSTELKEYDLMKFIHENFVGETRKDRISNFLKFSSTYLRDNYDMLNVMDKLIMNEQASISTWGVPFKVIENIVDNHGSLLDVFREIPMLRKSFLDGNLTKEDFTNRHGYKTIDDVIMQKLENFVNSEKIFPEHKDTDFLTKFADGSLNFTRWGLLFWSGIKETFQHPVAAALKATRYGGNILEGVAIAPVSTVSTVYKTLEPIAAISAPLHKLYKGLGDLIAGDFSEELALMELGVNAHLLFGKGEVNGFIQTWGVLNNAGLFIQNAMQKNRYIASRIVGINTIHKYLQAESFNTLKPSAKKMLSSLGIGDDISFKAWQMEIKGEEKGLRKALYENGFSDVTKKIHQLITRNSYEEDPISALRKSGVDGADYLTKVKMMFTSYNRSILKYYGDAIRYVEAEDGTYSKRFSFYGDNKLQGAGTGLMAVPILGLAGLAGTYTASKVIGDSKDEKMKARAKAALAGNKNSIKEQTRDIIEAGIPIDGFYSRYGGTALYSVGERMYEGITNFSEEWEKLFPHNAETLVRRFLGDRKYKKYIDLNKQERILYDRLVMADKVTNVGVGDFVDYVMAKLITDEMVEDGELTRTEALEIKREHGYNDKEIFNKLNERGLDTVKEYSLVNGETEDEVLENLYAGIEIISEGKNSKEEIVRKMNEKNEYYHDMKEYAKETENFSLTPEERDLVFQYTQKLEAEGYDALEIAEKALLFESQLHQQKKSI